LFWLVQTINVIEESRIIDMELLGLYAMLLAALAAGGECPSCLSILC
jgi:hypothetical protein